MFPGGVVPVKRCVVISSLSGRRAFKTAQLKIVKNHNKQKKRTYSYRHHLRKTPRLVKYELEWIYY